MHSIKNELQLSLKRENGSNYRQQLLYRVSKRCSDIAIALLLLVAIFPLALIIALMIKLESPGRVFFVQDRVGYRGRVFRMPKFRTMRSDACGNFSKPKKNDSRITKVGAYLRSTGLDELPQLWSVLCGYMSLVGPRPEMPFIVETYNEVAKRRLDSPPGITGLWQINGDRSKPIHEDLEHDLEYIQNCSLLLDAQILTVTAARTVASAWCSLTGRSQQIKNNW